MDPERDPQSGGGCVSLINDALGWLADPLNWTGPGSIPVRLGQHLAVTAIVTAIAALIAVPAGMLVGHTRRGAGVVGAVTGGLRAIPTLGLLTLFGLALGIGLVAPILALIVLAVPSLLAGTYSGFLAIDRSVPLAAKAVGMSARQVIATVELPLALPLIVGGLRAATLQVVATATLAAYISDTGLGRYLFAGLKSRDYAQMLGGALLVIAVALILELALAGCQSLATRVADPGRRRRFNPTKAPA